MKDLTTLSDKILPHNLPVFSVREHFAYFSVSFASFKFPVLHPDRN